MMMDIEFHDLIARIALDEGIEPAVLLAIIEVESGGKWGEEINGVFEPIIRFEGHCFYRLLPARKRNIAVTKRLAHSVVGKIANPVSQKARWKLLKKAQAIDRTAALSSVSWGIGQVMGLHWRWLEYASIDDFVCTQREGVSGQVRVMMRYLNKAGLIEKLRDRDWAGFARAYNGPAYARYKYHIKMQKAYLRLSGKKTTDARPINKMVELKYGSRGVAVQQMQSQLSYLGFNLDVDGDFGLATEYAVKRFQKRNSLTIDGIVGAHTFEVMMRMFPPVLA